MIFNRADYWRNVLSFDKTKNTCLILEELTEQELEFIEESFWVDFILFSGTPYNLRNLYVRNGIPSFLPSDLKNINYALYRGNDKEILYPLKASGITVIKDLRESLEEQTSIDRVNNFDDLTEL